MTTAKAVVAGGQTAMNQLRGTRAFPPWTPDTLGPVPQSKLSAGRAAKSIGDYYGRQLSSDLQVRYETS